MAVLVVGMVAADLGAAGAAEQSHRSMFLRGKNLRKGTDHLGGPFLGPVQTCLCPIQGVEGGQHLVVGAGGQFLEQLGTAVHREVTSFSFLIGQVY